MIIGFTGTQDGMTPQQKQKFEALLNYYKCQEFHAGDCVGADSEAHDIALNKASKIVIHPPNYANKRAFCDKKTKNGVDLQVLPEKWYIDRNHDIVDFCETMLATPREYSEQIRSGTWATIRYAKKIKKPLVVIFPDGTLKSYNVGEK